MPDKRISFDRVSEIYDATRAMPPEMEGEVIDRLIEIGGIEPHSRVLELGIGTGRIAGPLSHKVQSRYYGIDISLKMMKKISGKVRGHTVPVCADTRRLPFGKMSFDAVLAIHVLHLVENWSCAIDEAIRVMTPGGVIVIGGEAGDRRSMVERLFAGLEPAAKRKISAAAEKLDAGGGPPGVLLLDQAAQYLRKKGASLTYPPPVEHEIRTPIPTVLNFFKERSFQFLWEVPDDILEEVLSGITSVLEDTYGDLNKDIGVLRKFSFLRAAL